ncbi:BlaI/MecI/CopY family transcriptional regulator [Chengkuizengella axinellae]|uniref:BlaI/MecI/CopY family transcriptional regulator n=1 Tax=Chengkuizengella axinellae TaxID=3064388 RepID=A0ABT9J4C9_9BACL|nr:BlaI/MecI/CopY family transcriptional regulator [Chengkuizengella sp. 2205SS18-9]MDP5276408.1 BlaI/MecI/CopY family transcriptional regulator [Chengkuizengella sp. 2205SS18-9]
MFTIKEIPKISEAEWSIMKVLWEKSPLTSTEIIQALKEVTSWSPKTIHTLISRLVKKEAIGEKKESRLKSFFPLVTEEECKSTETKSFLKKVYSGSLQMFIANFVKDEKLSQNEIEELKDILDGKKDS